MTTLAAYGLTLPHWLRLPDRATTDLPPPDRPVDPGPVFIGDAAMACPGGTMLLRNWLRAELARDLAEDGDAPERPGA